MNTMQSHGSGVPDRIAFLSEPDILASQQYYDQGTSGRQPERTLMFAVLLDAVECFQEYAFLHHRQIECLEAAYRAEKNFSGPPLIMTNMRIVCSHKRRSGSSKRIGNGPFRSSISAKPCQLIRSICVKVSCIGSKTLCSQFQQETEINALPELFTRAIC